MAEPIISWGLEGRLTSAKDVHGNGIPMGMGTQIRRNGNGNRTPDNENGYFFMYAKIPIGPLTLVNFGARYGQFDVTRELPDRTHWLGMFQI